MVEDEIARVRPRASDELETSDPRIGDLAIEAVEQDFERLARRSATVTDERAAVLVILRELMHHLQVKVVRLAQ